MPFYGLEAREDIVALWPSFPFPPPTDTCAWRRRSQGLDTHRETFWALTFAEPRSIDKFKIASISASANYRYDVIRWHVLTSVAAECSLALAVHL